MPTFTFSVPSLAGDSDKKRAKGWQDFEKIAREGVWWFGPAEVKQLLKEITKRPKGRKKDVWIDEHLLEEFVRAEADAAPKPVNITEFARNFCKKYHQQSPEAVEKRFYRLREKQREAAAKKKTR